MGGCSGGAEAHLWSLSLGRRYPTDMNSPMHMPTARHAIGRDVQQMPLVIESPVGRARFLRVAFLIPSLSPAAPTPSLSASSALVVVVATCSYSYLSEWVIFKPNGVPISPAPILYTRRDGYGCIGHIGANCEPEHKSSFQVVSIDAKQKAKPQRPKRARMSISSQSQGLQGATWVNTSREVLTNGARGRHSIALIWLLLLSEPRRSA